MPTGGLRVRSPRFWQRRVWSHTTRHRSDLHYDLILYEHLFKYCVISKIADTLVYNSWRSNINVDGIQLIWNHGMLIYIYIYILVRILVDAIDKWVLLNCGRSNNSSYNINSQPRSNLVLYIFWQTIYIPCAPLLMMCKITRRHIMLR